MLELAIKDLYHWNPVGGQAHHIAVYIDEQNDVQWFTPGTPLDELPPGLWFRVTRVDEDVRVELETDLDRHPLIDHLNLCLQMSGHEPRKVVILLAGLIYSASQSYERFDHEQQIVVEFKSARN